MGWVIDMRTVIADFDGTFTSIDEEAKNFIPVFHEGVRKIADISEEEYQKLREVWADEIGSNPQYYGWDVGGKFVAPATCDSYVFNTVVAQQILKELGIKENGRLYGAFREAYKHAGIAFRPEAKEVLNQLSIDHNLFIVTNSSTDAVKSKIDKLSLDREVVILGNAKKYEINDSWKEVPESVDKGFGRPLYLRREKYHDILVRLPGLRSAVVIGDIYELDLLLPEYMGIDTVQIENPSTPKAEKDLAIKKGTLIQSLDEIFQYLR